MLTRRMTAAEQAQRDDSMSAIVRRFRSLPLPKTVPVRRKLHMQQAQESVRFMHTQRCPQRS